VKQGPHPTQVKALLALATQFLRAGRPADAVAPLREAAFLQPSDPTIQHDLGLACLEIGRLPEAIAAFQRAVASNPRDADAYFRLGIALEKLGDLGSAIVAYDRATELKPSLTEAWFRAGALVHTMGHREEAIGCFRRAAASGPKTRFGRLGAARALLTEERDVEAERVLREALVLDPANALATPGLEVAQRLRVHLALGKAADDLGRYALAMQHFDAADAVRQGSASFDSAAFDTEVNLLIERCTPDLISRAPELGTGDTTPVLIIGMPRSGTTLVEQIVSSHPKVGAGGELNFWNEQGAAWHQAGSAEPKAPFLRQAAAHYLGVLRTIGPKSARVTDKMPFNFLWAGLIHLAFPRATIIHCRRAALDTALSIHQTLFHPGLAFPTGGSKLVAYFRSYQRLTDHWRRVLPADRFIEVDYEDLTCEPEPVIRRIIAGCGLPWEDACLRPERNPRAVKTPSKWQTRQPIYRDSVERWRRYEPWLGPLRALLDGP
jgi:tetratricopeptide (TPR) repeat protein